MKKDRRDQHTHGGETKLQCHCFSVENESVFGQEEVLSMSQQKQQKMNQTIAEQKKLN